MCIRDSLSAFSNYDLNEAARENARRRLAQYLARSDVNIEDLKQKVQSLHEASTRTSPALKRFVILLTEGDDVFSMNFVLSHSGARSLYLHLSVIENMDRGQLAALAEHADRNLLKGKAEKDIPEEIFTSIKTTWDEMIASRLEQKIQSMAERLGAHLLPEQIEGFLERLSSASQFSNRLGLWNELRALEFLFQSGHEPVTVEARRISRGEYEIEFNPVTMELAKIITRADGAEIREVITEFDGLVRKPDGRIAIVETKSFFGKIRNARDEIIRKLEKYEEYRADIEALLGEPFDIIFVIDNQDIEKPLRETLPQLSSRFATLGTISFEFLQEFILPGVTPEEVRPVAEALAEEGLERAPPEIQQVTDAEAEEIVQHAVILTNDQRLPRDKEGIPMMEESSLPVAVDESEMRALLLREEFRPQYRFEYNGVTIFLSNPYLVSEGREAVVAYLRAQDGTIRLLSLIHI